MKDLLFKRGIAVMVASVLFSLSFSSCQPQGPGGKDHKFDTVGYYAFGGVTQSWVDYWLDCGIDTIELLDIGWYFKAGDRLKAYQEQMKNEIELAQKNGIKVYVVLLTNLEQWTGPEDYGNGSGKVFDPGNAEKMAERLGYIEDNIKYWNMADGFNLFSGDPGGVLGLPTVAGGLTFYIDMGKKVHALVKEHAPDAEYNLNIWAVSQYVQAVANPQSVHFWHSEGKLGRQIIEMKNLLGPEIGIEIPGHDYYRALALRLYEKHEEYPESYFPSKEDVAAMNEKGTARTWAFCHFLMDELDDGDTSGNSRTTLPSLNTRYIYKYVDSMRNIGMSGVIAGNATLNNYANLYAFARFCHDPEATPETVLREYANMLVTEEGADQLFEVLKYIENDANWHQKLPEREQIPLFETTIKTPREAEAILKQVTIRTGSSLSEFSLPETPEESVRKLKQRIAIMYNN